MADNDFNANPRAVPTTITGDRGPEQLTTDRRKIDMDDDISMYAKNQNPFKVITNKAKKTRTVTQYEFKWMNQDEYPRQLTLQTAATAADTTLVFDTNQYLFLMKNAVLVVKRTGESILVTVTPSADSVASNVRGIGSTAQDLVVGDVFYISAPIYEDGSEKGDLKTVKADTLSNFTEIVRTPFGVTGRDKNTDTYGGKDLATTRKASGIEHAKSLEYRHFFGTKASRTGAGGHLQTFSGGIKYFIQSNIWDLAGLRPTSDQFDSFLEEAMRWGQGGYQDGGGVAKKWLFHSARWAQIITSWGKDKVRLVSSDKVFGLKVTEYISPHGNIMLVHTPILDYNDKDCAFLIDLNHVKTVTHQGRNTVLLTNRQNPSADTYEEEYMTDSGTQVDLEASHAFIQGAV